MKTLAKKIVSCMVAVVLVCSFVPVSAMANSADINDEGIGEKASIVSTDAAVADTTVYLKAVDTSYQIDQVSGSGVWLEGEDMWVHTAYGDESCNSYLVSWYRQPYKLDPNATDENSYIAGSVETLVENHAVTTHTDKFVFNKSWDKSIDPTQYKYVYWAEVSQNVNGTWIQAKNTAEPSDITRMVAQWWTGPLYDKYDAINPANPGDWTWSAWGAVDSTIGATGLFPKSAELQSESLATSPVYTDITSAVQANENEQVFGAWDLNIVPGEDADGAFINSIRMTTDVTDHAKDILDALANGEISADQAKAKLEDSLKLCSYKENKLENIQTKYRIEQEGAVFRAYLDYFTDDAAAQASGKLGMVVLVGTTQPSGVDSHYVTLVVNKDASGNVNGTTSVSAGQHVVYENQSPTYNFEPDAKYYGEYKVEYADATNGGAWTTLTAGTDYTSGANFVMLGVAGASGDVVPTLSVYKADLRITVEFKEITTPPSADTEYDITLSKIGGASTAQITFIGSDGREVVLAAPGSAGAFPADAVGIEVAPPEGFSASHAIVTWADNSTETISFNNNAALISYLQSAASIEIVLEPSTLEPKYVNVTIDSAVRAYFDNIDSNGVQTVEIGGTASFNVTAPAWSTIKSISVSASDGSAVSSNNVRVGGIGEQTGSLVIYNVAKNLRVSAQFEYETRKLIVPAASDVMGASSIDKSGTYNISTDPNNPAKVTVRLDAGYELPATGVVLTGKLGGQDISMPAAAVKQSDGSYVVVVDLGSPTVSTAPGNWDKDAGITVNIAPTKMPVQEVFHKINTSVYAGHENFGSITQSFDVSDNSDALVEIFPKDDYVASVTVDGFAIKAVEAGGSSSANIVFYNGTNENDAEHYGAPALIIKTVIADYKVQASFAHKTNISSDQQPPDGGYRDTVDIISNCDSSQGTIEPGSIASVYKDTTNKLTAIPAERHELDKLVVDGVCVFYDGAQLKDDPDALKQAASAGVTFDASQQKYCIERDGHRDYFSVQYNEQTGSAEVVFSEVQANHDLSADFARFKEVDLYVDSEGGSVFAEGKVDGLKQMRWKIRKDLEVYITPEDGYGVSSAKLITTEGDGSTKETDISNSLEKVATSSVSTSTNNKLLSDMVGVVTGAEKAYAAASATSYKYVVPSSLMTQMEGESAIVRVAFAKDDTTNVLHSVKVDVREGAGFVQDANGNNVKSAKFSVRHADNLTFTLVPSLSTPYAYVQIGNDNRIYYGNAKQVTVQNVQADTQVYIDFVSIPYAGDNNSGTRALKHLQSLARTGDLSAPLAFGLLTVAFAACGIAMLASNRRRNGEED
ncbi:DUF2089 domain-containing protein [Adlercreutzia sp. ZJ304]|uniref:DUF2089 domain-containing protein n=1 Tax=Adlercreutzia sp. ZJ304 TaxID=2709791 RepID=UPI0013ECDF93|nr:DUF2089 domain-containing protein [Adlercreutzia sp. ZJ304]